MMEGAGGDSAGSPGAERMDAEEGEQGADHEDKEADMEDGGAALATDE